MGAPKGRVKAGGRKKGTPNKSTVEFREAVTNLLQVNTDNYCRWLTLVAEGDGANIKPDPAKALDLVAKLAEYAAPKLNRTEHVGEGGGPVETITRIELVDLDGDGAD
ncbi:hypothetical protein [Stenotrophomonas sp. UBA7606]|uniref:hypothetical protein n=1 Tax=Stenotrophomonas sp. UBA7606 TaxID=1947559 RepID=UPI0025E12CE9|nr:hypothetical protein [Stenotrophomonas sp. UBA7606]